MRRTPPYLRTLFRHLRENAPQPGPVSHIEIHHEDGCERPAGGPCTCNPEIASGPLVDRKHGGAP